MDKKEYLRNRFKRVEGVCITQLRRSWLRINNKADLGVQATVVVIARLGTSRGNLPLVQKRLDFHSRYASSE